MNAPVEGESISGSFCPNCGWFLRRDENSCPKCLQPIKDTDSDGFQLSIGFSVYVCDSCKKAFSLGASSCPHCGEIISDEEIIDPRKAPLNKLKLELLRETIQKVQALLDNLPLRDSLYPITDEQFLAHVNAHQIISSQHFENLSALFKLANVASEDAITSEQTRDAINEILHQTEVLTNRFRELSQIEVHTQLREFHILTLAHLQGLIEFAAVASNALLALTMEEFADMQKSLNQILSRLEMGTETMQSVLQNIDIGLVHKDAISNRLALLIGTHRNFEYRGLADPAAAFQAVINGRSLTESVPDFAEMGLQYFHGVIDGDPIEFPPDQSASLLMLAIESASYFDPVSLRRQAAALLQLYSAAFEKDQSSFADALSAADGDIESVTSNLLSLGDRLLIERPSDWPIDAFRHEITSSFAQLTESGYSHLINLPLATKRILNGHSHDYKSIAEKDFGSKFNDLKQIGDLRFASVLIGISTVARNASMHGRVDTSGEKILLTQRDRYGVETIEEYTDEEFLNLALRLVTTCRALLLAASLARIKFHAYLPPTSVRMMRRVAVESIKAIVGLGGLAEASVNANSPDTVKIEASAIPTDTPRGPLSDLFTTMLIAKNFPNHQTVELTTLIEGRRVGKTTLQIVEADAHFQLPEVLGKYSLVRLAYLTLEESESEEHLDQFLRKVVRPIALLLHSDLNSLFASFHQSQVETGDYGARLDDLKLVVLWLSKSLNDFNKDFQKSPIFSIQAALESLSRGLNQLISENRAGTRRQHSFENKHIKRCRKILGKWI